MSFGGGQTKTESRLTGSQQQMQAELFKVLQPQLEQLIPPGAEAPVYKGPRVAPLGALEVKGLDIMKGMPSGVPQYGETQAALAQGLSGQPSSQINPAATEAFFQKSIMAPAMRSWKEDFRPLMREGFVGPGTYWSGGRAEAERSSLSDLQESLEGKRAELAYSDVQAGRALQESAAQRQQAAVGQAPGVAGMPFQRAASFATGGALERQLAQQELQAQMSQFQEARPDLAPAIQSALEFIGQTSTVSYYQPGLMESLLPALGSLGGAMLPLLGG